MLNSGRSNLGCLTCRRRRVKCDGDKPTCGACTRLKLACSWQDPNVRPSKRSRRGNATACVQCKRRKLKCTGNAADGACPRCKTAGTPCSWDPAAVETPTSDDGPSSGLLRDGPFVDCISSEVEGLIEAYFDSVHHFGFHTFIHQLRFNRLLRAGKAPRELVLLMMANAQRFSLDPTPEALARADSWADRAIASLLKHVYQGFGAIDLMAMILAQHYDFHRQNFASAWLLSAHSTRMMQMMSLQTYDRTFSSTLSVTSALISPEALRRLAWSVFYADAIIDGGRYGFHTVDERSFRLQLPCEESSFLGNDTVVTEGLFPSLHGRRDGSSLGISGHLIRTAAARRRALYLAFRISHDELSLDETQAGLLEVEASIEATIASLPARFHFNLDNFQLHRAQAPAFFILHILRHNLYIILGRARLMAYQRNPSMSHLIPQVRRDRLARALPIAAIVQEGLNVHVPFDPQSGVFSYVALEILLFEPRRLAELDPSVDPQADRLTSAISPLLTVLRNLAKRSVMIRALYVEAVHRLLRCEFMNQLEGEDISAFCSEYHVVGQDEAEYDFREFRWAKLERQRRSGKTAQTTAGDEALLEFSAAETRPPSKPQSPKLDALQQFDVFAEGSVRNNQIQSQSTVDPNVFATGAPLINADDSFAVQLTDLLGTESRTLGSDLNFADDNVDHGMLMDFSWMLDESGQGGAPSGDPEEFWTQLMR